MLAKVKRMADSFAPRNTFVRGAGVLMGGTVAAQILMILASPLLTRLYTPEDFGVLAVYTSLLALVGIVSSLRYELAIPLPTKDQEAANVVALCLILVGFSSILTWVLSILMGDEIAQRLGVPRLSTYIWLLPIGVLLSGSYTVFNNLGIRVKQFPIIAKTKLYQAITALAVQFSAFTLGGVALLLGQIASQSAGMARLAILTLARSEYKNIRVKEIKQTAIRYRKFPKFSILAGLVNVAGHQLPPLVIAAYFAAHAAGLYALANRVLALPASLIGNAVAQVFFSHGAALYREGKLEKMYQRLLETLFQIGLMPTLIFAISGDYLFSLVFGEAWRDAGMFAQWLAVGVFAEFIASPLSLVFAILEKQRVGLLLQMNLFAARCLAIAIGIWYENLVMAVSLFALASLWGYILYIVVSAKYVGCQLRRSVRVFMKNVIVSILFVLPLFFARIYEETMVFMLALVISSLAAMVRLLLLVKKIS